MRSGPCGIGGSPLDAGARLRPVRKAALAALSLVLAFAGFLTASVLAGPQPRGALTDSTTSTTDTTVTTDTTTTTAPTTPPSPAPRPKPKPKPSSRLAKRVSIGGIFVGGLTPQAALAAVKVSFRSPLVLTVDDRRLSVSPARLGAKPYVDGAMARAQRARPGTKVPLVVTVKGSAVRSWVADLAARTDREVRDARVVLQGLRPVILEERAGLVVRREATVAAVVDALRANRRGPLAATLRRSAPEVRASSFTSIVVVRRESKELRYYERERLVKTFKVATGLAQYPTPLGSFEIIQMWRNPWWYPPPSPWAAGEKPVPPGPGNPLGTRWMGISSPAVGIHGTPDAASLGYSASHGCIRMAIPSAEWLFSRVRIGTPVFIVRA